MEVTRPEIAPNIARQMVATALDHAGAQSWQVAVAVCDPSGDLVAFGRSDHVARPSINFAIDKAHTAGSLGKSTKAFGERMLSDPALALGLANRPRLMVWGGGVAILTGDGICIGGIGVSGAQDFEDIEAAQKAIAAAGYQPG